MKSITVLMGFFNGMPENSIIFLACLLSFYYLFEHIKYTARHKQEIDKEINIRI